MIESDPINWSAVIVTALTTGGYAFRCWLGYRERQGLRAKGQNVPIPPEGPAPTMLLLCGALAGLILSDPAAHGMALLPPRRPVELCRPACARNERCVGRTCTLEARPVPGDTATSQAPAEKPQPLPPKPPRAVGPQRLNYAISVQRWTDGRDPFDRESAQ